MAEEEEEEIMAKSQKTSFSVGGLSINPLGADPIEPQVAENDASEIPAAKIKPSPYNEGLDMSRVEEYAASMKEVGLISPIVVYDMGDGTYQILTGHQRFEAWCKVLKHSTIQAFVRPYETDPVKRFIAHTEANTLSREKDLKFWQSRIKMARAVLKETGFSGSKEEETQELVKMLNGISRAQIYRYDGFEKLIPELQEFESKKWLSASTLYMAAGLDGIQQKEVARRVNETYSAFSRMAEEQNMEFEITRNEFKKIVDAVRLGTKPSKKKRTGYSDRIGSATVSFIKAIGNPKTDEERSASLKEIAHAREALNELEKKLRS